METLAELNSVEFSKAKNTKENTINQNDSGCETSTIKSIDETFTSTYTIENIDTTVLKTNPQSNRKQINKTAYAKLQRSLSPTRNSKLDSLKLKYEKSDNESEITKSNNETHKPQRVSTELKSIRHKSKLPLPTPRNGVKSEIFEPTQKVAEKSKYRHSLILDKKTKRKDENSNTVFRKNSSSSGEFITIITRSESVETVDKFEEELNLFTMDKKQKDKKRTNSFRKIFTGKIFSKEKKKKDDSENNFLQQKRNVHSDNLQNENHFSRQSPNTQSNIPKPLPQETQRRITPQNINMQEIERRYAQMHVKEFNNIKQNFENQNHIDETDPIPTVTPGPMDFGKMPNINKFIDTSSSASMESDKDVFSNQENPYKTIRFADNQRDTPPRAQELRQTQDVRLVNPKALIPINSERPLPNPYQNISSVKPVISPKPQINSLTPKPKTVQHFDFNSERKHVGSEQIILDETYGTVFDSISMDRKNNIWIRNPSTKPIQKPPMSPSLEPSKLRLPYNRDVGPASPRMKSPIPQHHVSAEKLIATELLRVSRSPTPTKKKTNQINSSNQKLDSIVTSKPPISRVSDQVDFHRNSQLSPYSENRNYQTPPISKMPESMNSQASSNYENMNPTLRLPEHMSLQRSANNHSQERLIGNTILNSTVMRSPTPNNLLQNTEITPLRPQSSRSSTPVDLRIPQSSTTPSPQKEEIRKTVEAYYWKEIKKLKEQENRDLYYYQMQMMPFGFAEDPVNFRRSRSSSPSSHRNGRRSLSLPRESKSQTVNVEINDNYGRYQPAAIPEGRAVVNYPDGVHYQQNFRRNAPERRTIDAIPRSNGNTIYRPIFKRGSLSTPVRDFSEDQQQKKVSFNNGQQREVWPTRNGYTQNPPQRRMESIRHDSIDDDVFLPNPQQTSKLIVDGKEIYGYTNRPYDNHIKRQQDPHYQNANFYKQIHQEPVYYTRSNQQEDANRMPRYNSMQLVEPLYEQQQRVSRRMSFDNSQGYISRPQLQQNVTYNMPRRQVYVKDDIYGYFGGYIPNDQQRNVVYSSKQNMVEPTYGYGRGVPKQVTVKDKVCDMYGQIHDRDSPSLNIRKSGVMLGQLQQGQQSYPQQPNQNFVRNSRLTASANDMYRRYQNVDPKHATNLVHDVQNDRPPSRPLPPVPMDKKLYYRQNTDSIQEFSDVQQNSSVGKSKKRGIFGKMEPTNERSDKNFDIERSMLLEQLYLLKRQQELEMQRWKWQQREHKSLDEYQEYGQHSLENQRTKQLSISDLKKEVLLEELKLLRLKIKMEINLK